MYDGILYQVKQGASDRGINAENMEKSQHTNFNEDMTNESTSVAFNAVKAGHSERMKKHDLLVTAKSGKLAYYGHIMRK